MAKIKDKKVKKKLEEAGGELALPKKNKREVAIQEKVKSKKKKGLREKEDAPKAAYGKGLEIPFTIPGFDVASQLDAIEKKIGVGSSGLGGKHDTRMSSGVLGIDGILGGGITAGWYTNFGQEQSCKSTDAMTIIAAAVMQRIPILSYSDYEGSTEPNYLQNMMNTMGVNADITDVFGIRNLNGEYVKYPRVRYLPSDTAEQFFDYMSALERRLPDKIYQGGQWWFVYENTNENRKRLKESGDEYSKKMFSKYNKFYVSAPDGSLQALLVVDSYPAMLPEELDVDDPNNGLAAVARMFAKQLPRVKGKMRKKRIAVIGVNQLRDVPMAKYGPPEKEAAGNAVRFFSDVRMRWTARAISAVPDATRAPKGSFEEEKSVEFEGGTDTYRYVNVKADKNKFSTPYLSTFVRLWISDGGGNARGFDPVWDVLQYLRDTGQIVEKKKRVDLLLKFKGNEATKSMDWKTFKLMILSSDKAVVKEICVKYGMKPMFLRKQCFRQMAKGEGLDMIYEAKRDKDMKKKEKVDEDGVITEDDDDEDE
jgi:RecA/RadA recombinase